MTMPEVRRILVPTDLSAFGEIALRWGLLFRERTAAALTVLHAHELPVLAIAGVSPLLALAGASHGSYSFPTPPEELERLNREVAAWAAAHVPAGIEPQVLLVEDAPAHAIVGASRDGDLVVMGTHGRRGFQRFMLGSVTERVLRESEVPVLTVLASPRPVAVRRVLCPFNATPVAHEALAWAAAICRWFAAELDVVHVAAETSEPGAPVASASDLRALVEAELRDLASFDAVVVPGGNVAERILETAAERNADLVVIGAQHRPFAHGSVIGATTERVTRFAKQPVLTVSRAAR